MAEKAVRKQPLIALTQLLCRMNNEAMNLCPKPEEDRQMQHGLYRIAVFPRIASTNPYMRLFYSALQPYDVEAYDTLRFNYDWLHEHATQFDAIHIHWPEWFLQMRGRRLWNRIQGLVILHRYLKWAGTLGLKRIWTVHNIEPHEACGWTDRISFRTIAQGCDLVVCHSNSAAEAVRENLRYRGEIVVVPHGNYAGQYPPPQARAVVLRGLGLSMDCPTVCCVGVIRQYKGVDLACEAVRLLKGKVQFVIAGKPYGPCDLDGLRNAAADIPGVRLIARELSTQEFSDIVSVCDAVLLPYRKITSSGAIMAAWTLGRGVVASDLPCFKELLPKDGPAGVVFRSGDPAAHAAAIIRYLQIPAEARVAAAFQMARQYSWDSCVRPFVAILRKWGDQVSS